MEQNIMIPRFKPNIGTSEFLEIFKKSKYKQVEIFEAEFAALVDQKHGLAFSYGRMALLAYLKAEGIFDKEIICPAYTCIVIAHAIEESGNRCVFVDINPDDLLMNSENLKEAISMNTAAIVFTSLYGNPINVEDVLFVKNNHPEIKIIQDCTHIVNGERIVEFGDISIFGLGLSKLITSVFGGMLTTNDTELFERVKKYRNKYFVKKRRRNFYMRLYLILVFMAFNKHFYIVTNFLERRGFIDYFVKLFDKNKISLPNDSFERLSSFEAKIGRVQIRKFPQVKEHNRKIAEIYKKEISGNLKISYIHPKAIVSHCNLLTTRRDSLVKEMLSDGVQLGDLYEYSLPELKPYSSHRFHQKHNYAAQVSGQIVNLPLCVSEQQALKIASLLNKYS